MGHAVASQFVGHDVPRLFIATPHKALEKGALLQCHLYDLVGSEESNSTLLRKPKRGRISSDFCPFTRENR